MHFLALEQMNVHKEIEKTKEEINKVEKNILQAHSQLKEAEKILVCLIILYNYYYYLYVYIKYSLYKIIHSLTLRATMIIFFN